MDIKEASEIFAYIVAGIGGPITAVSALLQWRETLLQRKIEFRWKQADLGRQLLDQLFDEPIAGIALNIIDGEIDCIELQGSQKIVVDKDAINKALSLPSDNSLASRQIRRAFDALLYYFERLENGVCLNLIEREDIAIPTSYYCRKLETYMPVLRPYAGSAGYDKAIRLIENLQKR